MLDKVIEHLLGKCGYTKKGEEIPDPTPMALPVGFRRPETLGDRMKILLRNEEFKRAQEALGEETFEEADDFDVDDPDPLDGAPYEDNFDPDCPGAIAREQEFRAGQVVDRPLEKKQKAKEFLDKHKKKSAEAPIEPKPTEK